MSATVLIIEDNPLNMELATDLLVAHHFQVWQACTAEDGLRLARALIPDLVLVDLSLPGMDGLSATKALRNDSATREIKIVALTAHAMRGDEEMAIRAGCDGYLTKPINTRSFPRQISDFIRSLVPQTQSSIP
jgi:two-component system cell cycle response regulator/two-component system cell cycle response regulator DivK